MHKTQFVTQFNALAKEIHETARDKGWWENKDADFLDGIALILNNEHEQGIHDIADTIRRRNDGEMIALMHSELSEALEAIRHGNPPDDKIPEFSGAEAELADVIIRIMDMSHARGWRVGEAIIAKMEMNKGRAYKHGGKAF